MTIPAEIAKGLTEAQRRALTGARHEHIPSFTAARCRAWLQDKGLVESPMYSTRLTPLGLAVRKHLESKS